MNNNLPYMRHEGLLCGIYNRWLAQEGLPAMSADELILESISTVPQKKWLHRFCTAWERAINIKHS